MSDNFIKEVIASKKTAHDKLIAANKLLQASALAAATVYGKTGQMTTQNMLDLTDSLCDISNALEEVHDMMFSTQHVDKVA